MISKAFKDDLHNYYAWPHSYKAIRVPPLAETGLKQKIQAGILNLDQVQAAEQAALVALRAYVAREIDLDSTLEKIDQYDQLVFPQHNSSQIYAQTLAQRPWEQCRCQVCQQQDQEYPLQAIVMATGFDAMTGAKMKIDICGLNG